MFQINQKTLHSLKIQIELEGRSQYWSQSALEHLCSVINAKVAVLILGNHIYSRPGDVPCRANLCGKQRGGVEEGEGEGATVSQPIAIALNLA